MKSAAISSQAMSLQQPVSAAPVAPTPVRFGSPDVEQERRSTSPVRLTPRQLEVLSLLCQGLPNKLICRQLNIAAGTVKVHIGCILKELGVTSRLQAVVSAGRFGLLKELVTGTSKADDSAGAHLSTITAGTPKYGRSYQLAVPF